MCTITENLLIVLATFESRKTLRNFLRSYLKWMEKRVLQQPHAPAVALDENGNARAALGGLTHAVAATSVRTASAAAAIGGLGGGLGGGGSVSAGNGATAFAVFEDAPSTTTSGALSPKHHTRSTLPLSARFSWCPSLDV